MKGRGRFTIYLMTTSTIREMLCRRTCSRAWKDMCTGHAKRKDYMKVELHARIVTWKNYSLRSNALQHGRRFDDVKYLLGTCQIKGRLSEVFLAASHAVKDVCASGCMTAC